MLFLPDRQRTAVRHRFQRGDVGDLLVYPKQRCPRIRALHRPKRGHDTMSASKRMRFELAEAASNFVPGVGGLKTHGHRCGDCVDFEECRQVQVRNAKADQTYCAWKTRTWRPKDAQSANDGS